MEFLSEAQRRVLSHLDHTGNLPADAASSTVSALTSRGYISTIIHGRNVRGVFHVEQFTVEITQLGRLVLEAKPRDYWQTLKAVSKARRAPRLMDRPRLVAVS